jgi:hypothetical protein
MATLKWVMGSLMMMMGPLNFMFTVLTTSVSLFGNTAVLAWLKAFGPIAGVIGLLLALAFVLRGLTHKDGFTGMIWGWIKSLGYFMGFMYNFKDNFMAITTFIGKNFATILIDLFVFPVQKLIGLLLMVPRIMSNVFGFDLPDWVDNAESGLAQFARSIANGKLTTGYDTSMFKFDGPSIDDLPFLEDMGKSVTDALKPFLPASVEQILKDKPNIDFNKFIKDPEGEGVGKIREHALAGSAEHALRMYQFDQQVMGRVEAEKKAADKRQEELLKQIEKNTRNKSNMRESEVANADLWLTWN